MKLSSSFYLSYLAMFLSWFTRSQALNIQHEKLFDNDAGNNHDSLRGKIQKDPSLPDELIIVLTDNYMNVADITSKVKSLVMRTGGKIKHVYNSVFKGAAITNITEDKMLELLDNNDVKYGVPNKVVTIDSVQQNPVWGLDRIDQKSLPLNKKYKYSYTGRGVTVWVLDSGINVNHSQFGGRATCEFNAIDNEPCDDLFFHGTHVAGTVGGKTFGVAKNVKLIAGKVLNAIGEGELNGVVAAIDYVTNQKIKNRSVPTVINMSLGGSYSKILNDAVDAASRQGVIVVVAAGNSFFDDACNYSPASASKAIAVGATDIKDNAAYFTNVGRCVDIFAPGVDVTSANITCPTCNSTFSGTSMASPHVAGIVALYLERNKTVTPETLWSMIRGDATMNMVKGLKAGDFTPNLLINTLKI